eukprot:5589205-Pyramimonas_sp.AAC.1
MQHVATASTRLASVRPTVNARRQTTMAARPAAACPAAMAAATLQASAFVHSGACLKAQGLTRVAAKARAQTSRRSLKVPPPPSVCSARASHLNIPLKNQHGIKAREREAERSLLTQ